MDEFEYEFSSYTINSEDKSGRKITEIKRFVEEKYILYFVEMNYLEVFCDVASNYDIKENSILTNKMTEVDKWVIGKNSKKKSLSFIREGFSNAYIAEFDGCTDAAILHLENLINKIKNYNLLKFMIGSGIPVFLVSILSILIYYFNWFGDKIHIKNIIFCVTFSSLGSLFFHFMKYFYRKEYEHEIDTISGMLSFFKSAISGILIYIVIKSNLVLGIASENIFVIISLSLASGFNDDIPVKLIMKIADVINIDDK